MIDSVFTFLTQSYNTLNPIMTFLGWVSAIALFVWRLIEQKRRLILSTIPTATFGVRIPDSHEPGQNRHYRLAFMLYLRIFNPSSKPVDIARESLTYRTDMLLFQKSRLWSKMSSLERYISCLSFLYAYSPKYESLIMVERVQHEISGGMQVRVIPRLFQADPEAGIDSQRSYLLEQQATSGTVYFESDGTCWKGGCPRLYPGRSLLVKVFVECANGKIHKRRIRIPIKVLESARVLYTAVGNTNERLRNIDTDS